MTMFSMKPKFDLAAFLAVPAPAGAARRRAAKSGGIRFQSATIQERADTAASSETQPEAAAVATDHD